MLLTCNEGEEVDAEYRQDLDLGLLVHVGVYRDGVVQQQRDPAHLPKLLRTFLGPFQNADL
jgi:hypothetical protein